VIKKYYLSNNHGIAANYHDIFITLKEGNGNTMISNTIIIYYGIFTLEEVSYVVNYSCIFITLALRLEL
jgi:hypothetical protein